MSWLPRADFDVFVDQFRTSGFFGPVSWYRNLDANYDETVGVGPEQLTMPTAFIGGELDPVISGRMETVAAMTTTLPNFVGSVIIPSAGHWVQQEAPGAFNDALLSFLSRC